MTGEADGFCAIAILMYGDSLSMDEVSALIGLTPTRTRIKGDVRTTSSGSQVVQRIGFWGYRVRVGTDQIESTISALVGAIDADCLVGQCGIEKAEVDIFVPLDPDLPSDGPRLSMELTSGLMRRLAVLGFDVILTSY